MVIQERKACGLKAPQASRVSRLLSAAIGPKRKEPAPRGLLRVSGGEGLG